MYNGQLDPKSQHLKQNQKKQHCRGGTGAGLGGGGVGGGGVGGGGVGAGGGGGGGVLAHGLGSPFCPTWLAKDPI